MKNLLAVLLASLALSAAAVSLEHGSFTLAFLIGYLVSILVPILVLTAVLSLLLLVAYRLITGEKMARWPRALWGIWALVAAVNFYGVYQQQQARSSAADTAVQRERPGAQGAESPVARLQRQFAQASQELDKELARQAAAIQLPPLFDPAFVADKSRFPAAAQQLQDYAKLFEAHKDQRARLLSELRDDLSRLDLPSVEQSRIAQIFESTYELDHRLSQAYFDLVIEVSRQGIAYLDFLRRAQYQLTQGRVALEVPGDQEAFDALVEAFRALSAREAAAQQELRDSRDARMERLRELSH